MRLRREDVVSDEIAEGGNSAGSQSEPTGLTFESSMFVEARVIDCKSMFAFAAT